MRLGLFAILLSIAGIVVLFRALDLIPPQSLRIAAGGEGSAYHAIAQRYRAILAADGIRLEIVETAGSVDNLARLLDEDGPPVDVALLQGGIDPRPADGPPPVEALASVFLEPVLIFQRPDLGAEAEFTDWADLRVAIGPEGSGTRAAILRTLGNLGISMPSAHFSDLGGARAAEALLAGDLDVAVFIAPITAGYLQPLLGNEAVTLAQIRDVDALERRLNFVEIVTVPRGGLDYRRRLPEDPVRLPALVARLAARPDLHPALVDRLVRAAQRVHGGHDIITAEGRFPTMRHAILPHNAQAEAIVGSPPSPLDRWLPFWIVAQINRVAVLLLPIVFLLLPLLRALPGLYRWSMHKRIYRHYDAVLAIDSEVDGARDTGALGALDARLGEIEAETRSMRVPSRYGEYLYALQLHLDLVRRRIAARRRLMGDQSG